MADPGLLDQRERLLSLCRQLPQLPAYEAALAYRDVVRLESGYVLSTLPDALTRGKYATYVKRFTRPAPGRYFTDHHYAQKLAGTIERVRASRTLIDAACGNGFEAVLFALLGCDVIANDISSARTEVAAQRVALYQGLLGDTLRIRVTCGNAIALAGTIPPADLVYVQEAISHIHPAEDFLRAVGGLLRSGGHLILCDSNGWNPVIRVRIARQLWRERRTLRSYVEEMVDARTGQTYLMAEERLFGPPSISRAMRTAGFAVEELRVSGFAPPFIARTSPAPLARRVDDFFRRVPGIRNFGAIYTLVGRKIG